MLPISGMTPSQKPCIHTQTWAQGRDVSEQQDECIVASNSIPISNSNERIHSMHTLPGMTLTGAMVSRRCQARRIYATSFHSCKLPIFTFIQTSNLQVHTNLKSSNSYKLQISGTCTVGRRGQVEAGEGCSPGRPGNAGDALPVCL